MHVNDRVAVHIQDPVGLSCLVETVTLSAPGCRCRLHDAAKSDTVLQDVESVRPFKAGCVIFKGSATGRGPGQDPRMPTPTQKYFAVSNEPKHGASHSSLDLDRASPHSIL